MVGRFLDGLKSIFERKQPPVYSIILLDKGIGFRIEENFNPIATVLFSEVKEVFAFKRDLLTIDQICFGFRTGDDGTYCEVDEHMSGYDALLKALEIKYEIKLEHWFSKVAFPAFEKNFTSLWGEPYPYQRE